MTNPTIARIRHEISRIPAGVGRDAQSYKEELDRTLDALSETTFFDSMDEAMKGTYPSETKPLQLREGGWYRRRDGEIDGPCKRREDYSGTRYPWEIGGVTYGNSGEWYRVDRAEPRDLIAEVPAPTATLSVPVVPVEIGQYLRVADKNGYATPEFLAIVRGLQAQITALNKLAEALDEQVQNGSGR